MALLAISPLFKLWVIFLLLFGQVLATSSPWIQYPSFGYATLTHYSLPLDFVASCGCTGESTHYPTAALSQMAYGSSTAYGPACGKCFNLTLLNTFLSTPPWYPAENPNIVVKVTDLCPLSTAGFCNATTSGPNSGGHYLNFDLAYPSTSISNNFFPTNESYYGYSDFGVWNISYESIDCNDWEGWNNAGALGSVADQSAESVCCPASPDNSSNTCPSYSDHNGIAPDTTTSAGHSIPRPYIFTLSLVSATLLSLFVYFV
ncbi:hypothetical protein BT96DRAFT_961244 [Gymnopus androsaceus JB14]|uniref:Expansin-like EG45 domain-containing protein n=1 Tax=Gymnopus androsaceus JB14 TaxID=1447944 RepID=A0A6A4IPP1_9AGAR|nr:hypothetical protein BT96DRAFT_961244 [Gymnopus androsaceus JB14]